MNIGGKNEVNYSENNLFGKKEMTNKNPIWHSTKLLKKNDENISDKK